MIQITLSTFIQQPIHRVFNFISTPENDFQWQYETLSSNQTSEGIITVGSSFRSIGHFMGNRTQSTFEVTEFEPNKRYGFKSLSGPLQSVISYTFDISKRYTEVKISAQANIVNTMEFNENILEKKLKRQIKENLAMLKKILETG